MEDVHRLVVEGFLSAGVCKELEFIHKSCSVMGYRPHVRSTTLSHLIATNCSGLVLPFLSIRERLKELIEERFGCEFELFVEFTGLISWTKGARIGWHSDDNKPYLKQRHFSVRAVCYLNDYDVDFRGGLFRFEKGEPSTVVPTKGTVVIYSADEKNMHSVDEILCGERCTLALWFTRDSAHDEDGKLIQQLARTLILSANSVDTSNGSSGKTGTVIEPPFSCCPVPASPNMYWTANCDQDSSNSGYDICLDRLASLGFTPLKWISSLPPSAEQQTERTAQGPSESAHDLKLESTSTGVSYTFKNSLHALQVLQFRVWQKESGACNHQLEHQVSPSMTKLGSPCIVAETPCPTIDEAHSIYEAQRQWECYTSTLRSKVIEQLPQWMSCQCLSSSPF